MTSRDVTAGFVTASKEHTYYSLVFAAIAIPSGTVYLHNGIGSYTFGGNTYLGIGDLGGIDAMEETYSADDVPLKLMMTSLDDNGLLTAVQDEDLYECQVDIMLGATDENGALVADPDIWWSGFIDKVELVQGAENGVALTCVTRASLLKKSSSVKFTDEQLQREYSGDLFFQYLPQVIEAKPVWGGNPVYFGYNPNTGGSGDGGGGGRPRGGK